MYVSIVKGFVQCLWFLVFLSLKLEGNIRENSKNRKVRRVADVGDGVWEEGVREEIHGFCIRMSG